eukprot:g4609.t1
MKMKLNNRRDRVALEESALQRQRKRRVKVGLPKDVLKKLLNPNEEHSLLRRLDQDAWSGVPMAEMLKGGGKIGKKNVKKGNTSKKRRVRVVKPYEVPLHLRKPFQTAKYNRRALRGPEAALQYMGTFPPLQNDNDEKEVGNFAVLKKEREEKQTRSALTEALSRLNMLTVSNEREANVVDQLSSGLAGLTREFEAIQSLRSSSMKEIVGIQDDFIARSREKLQETKHYLKTLRLIEERLINDKKEYPATLRIFEEAIFFSQLDLEESKQEAREIRSVAVAEAERLQRLKDIYTKDEAEWKREIETLETTAVRRREMQKKLFNENFSPPSKKSMKAKSDEKASLIVKELTQNSLQEKLRSLYSSHLSHQEAFQKIFLATGLREEKDIIDAFLLKDEYIDGLNEKIRELNEQLEKLREKKRIASKALQQVKYVDKKTIKDGSTMESEEMVVIGRKLIDEKGMNVLLMKRKRQQALKYKARASEMNVNVNVCIEGIWNHFLESFAVVESERLKEQLRLTKAKTKEDSIKLMLKIVCDQIRIKVDENE